MNFWASFWASIIFYTCIPLHWVMNTEKLNFQRIARFAPWVGLVLGAGLGLLDQGLVLIHFPNGPRTALVVVVWLGLTGGLHMDGAMDSADGLAVQDPQRRLTVMADSRTGAFGAMVAIVIVLLKFTSLAELPSDQRIWALMLAAGWGRLAQVWAIAHYPYLKPTGKGAFHKQYFQSPWDGLLGLGGLLALATLEVGISPQRMIPIGLSMILAGAIAWATGAWFNRQLGGHTGDTYGAVVEWTEALVLCGFILC
jgi:adenosylcobinamide-GDP ribazoletransferase